MAQNRQDLIAQAAETDPALADVMGRLTDVFAQIARRIARGELDEDLASAAGTNTDGDAQKALDVIADNAFMDRLSGSAVRYYASEEQDDVVELNANGSLALAIDPLDGSSNIDTNVSVGTIFGIYHSASDPKDSFLRPGRDLIAAGYAIYGPQCSLVISFGNGVQKYILDPDEGQFLQVDSPTGISTDSPEYAINASNYRHWSNPVRAYIDDLVAGADGPRARNFNLRWIASLVAETHRILIRGGIFLYPGDNREGYQFGRLRLVYECAPIAFLIENAGGSASNCCDPILDQVPDSLHARSPLVFGGKDKVMRVASYHDLPQEENAALFGERGLFRT
ncbi:Fructose-1,6-bisphosphatase class 1 [Ruegeria sp. THAF57]|uniref:class 1 fructose-bisphosphatase n=1 Tax=Ruegeria sp. THAF57 TaxID=2744555 RepID=UPI0015DF9C15|nr:class 1 fructose-bisphosphatase [Ruegeria sp. THAF57]CAD0186801.1 Fructose-1,6-bisphosphatase class 1 [Ruegeria sp. THAF57]